MLVGATPVFVDIDPDTYNIDPYLVEQAITKETKAIMPVSLYGQTADMRRLQAIAGRPSAFIIEDAAQSLGRRITAKSGLVYIWLRQLLSVQASWLLRRWRCVVYRRRRSG